MEEQIKRLQLSLEHGRSDAVRHVLDHQAQQEENASTASLISLTAMTHQGITMPPLHYAFETNQTDIARMMLSAGADILTLDSAGRTAIQVAELTNSTSLIINELLTAVAQNNLERIAYLQNAGLSLDSIDDDQQGNSCLHWAAALSKPETVQFLLEHGANVNSRNAQGATPLHDAAKRGNVSIIELLLQHGADRTIQGHSGVYAGKLALDMANTVDDETSIRKLHSLLDTTNPVPVYTESYTESRSIKLENSTVHSSSCRSTSSSTSPGENKNGGVDKNSWIERIDHLVQIAADSMDQEELQAREQEVYQKQLASLSAMQIHEDSSNSDLLLPCNQSVGHQAISEIQNICSFDNELVIHSELSPALRMLWPQPRNITQIQGHPFIPNLTVEVYFAIYDRSDACNIDFIWEYMRDNLQRLGYKGTRTHYPSLHTSVTCRITPNLVTKPEAYRLIIDDTGVIINGGDTRGLRYGCVTFLQMMQLCCSVSDTMNIDVDAAHTKESLAPFPNRVIPSLRIYDYPDLPNRGFMLDVSRDKVPKMSTLFQLVDTMAMLKMNQLHLYMEHTFAYSDHQIVWEGADPYTAADICELDHHCRRHGIQLVPNQNSLGHFHRFLRHERYRHLAECPDGINFGPRPSGPADSPFSLCPVDPRAVNLVSSLYNELFPNFASSNLAHVGLDETVDIGEGVSQADCDQNGHAAVYLSYLHEIRNVCRQHRRTMMFWADMLHDFKPDTMYSLPSDVIAMEWGYEESHPFESRCLQMADAGVPFYLCPGTSSWNSLTGRTLNCIANVKSACIAAHKHDGLGVL
eukprot:gene3463-6098_t